MEFAIAKVSTKGQIVIPALLRRKYGIKAGTKFIVTDDGEAIILKPVTEQYLKALQGSLRGKGTIKILNEEHFGLTHNRYILWHSIWVLLHFRRDFSLRILRH